MVLQSAACRQTCGAAFELARAGSGKGEAESAPAHLLLHHVEERGRFLNLINHAPFDASIGDRSTGICADRSVDLPVPRAPNRKKLWDAGIRSIRSNMI